MLKSIPILLTVLLMSACTSSIYTVADKDEKELAGIPFYIAKPITFTTNIYEEPWSILTLAYTEKKCIKTKSGKCTKWTEGDVTEYVKYVTPQCAEELINFFNTASSPLQLNTDVISVMVNGQNVRNCKPQNTVPIFRQQSDIMDDTQSEDRPKLVLSSMTTEMKIENGEKHYINVNKPWIGSATATIKLNESGRLTESTGTIDDKTVETFLGALPIKEFISHDLGLDDDEPVVPDGNSLIAASTSDVGDSALSAFSLSLDSLVYVYKLTTSDHTPVQITYTATARSLEKQSEGDQEGSISFSGNVILPEK